MLESRAGIVMPAGQESQRVAEELFDVPLRRAARNVRTSSLPYRADQRVAHLGGAFCVDDPGTRVRSRWHASRAFRSTSRRCAVRLPTPARDDESRRLREATAQARRRVHGEDRKRELRPDATRVINASNVSRSSRLENPNRISASSRTC